MSKIYIVDEDEKKLRAFAVELGFRGFEVEMIGNADLALEMLSSVTVDEVALVIIDVMLAAGANATTSAYDAGRTNNFRKTGLCLLEDLTERNGDVFPKCAVFLSHAATTDLIKDIERASADHNVPFLRKGNYTNAFDFSNKIEEIVKCRTK